MTLRYHFPATCPSCGKDMHHAVDGTPTDGGTRTSAIAVCARRVPHRWQVVVELVPIRDDVELPA